MKRLQVRLTFDDEMGPFFHWLSARPPKVRARELVAMARSGYAVVHGVHAPAETSLSFAGPSPGSGKAAAVEPPRVSITETAGSAADAAAATFGSSFLLATPPVQ